MAIKQKALTSGYVDTGILIPALFISLPAKYTNINIQKIIKFNLGFYPLLKPNSQSF